MKKMLVIFNHEILSNEQANYAKSKMNVDEINYLTNNLKSIWKQIDPHTEKIDLTEIENFILNHTHSKDFVLIQGEFGASYKIINFCFQHNRIPVYATTERKSEESINKEGNIEKRSIFKFVRFRMYEKIQ